MRRKKAVKEVNAGMYCFNGAFLRENLPKLSNQNAQNEYYITDHRHGRGKRRGCRRFCGEPDEIMGVNNRIQFPEASRVMRRRIAERHMTAGVTIVDPESVCIEEDVVIGNDTEIWPGAELKAVRSSETAV